LERRRRIRFAFRAPAHFRWENPDGSLLDGQGFTRDISSHGAYVYAEIRPPVNSEVHIEIILPSVLEVHGTLRLSAKAKIIRVEPSATDEQAGGFVAQSDSYELREDLAAPPD
jgi:hypothetical protein